MVKRTTSTNQRLVTDHVNQSEARLIFPHLPLVTVSLQNIEAGEELGEVGQLGDSLDHLGAGDQHYPHHIL